MNAPMIAEKPERPGDDECCGGGCCDPCIWDHYYNRLAQWEAQNSDTEESQQQSQ